MGGDIQFIDLRREPPARRVALTQAFYEQIYRDAFPIRDEAESPETWLPLLGEVVPSGQPHTHIVLACDPTSYIVGGAIFEEYRISGCWLFTYLVVHPHVRGRGIASRLLAEVLRIMAADQSQEPVLLAEAEDPARIAAPADRAFAEARLRILDRLGLRRLPIDYVQPALGPDKSTLDSLFLLCFDPAGDSCVPARRIDAFLHEFYAACGQADSPYVAQISLALAKEHALRTRRLVS
jgi:GNAT superfamily N-acetyltransferase